MFQRILDIIVSSIALLVSFPFFLLGFFLGLQLFSSLRIGKNQTQFTLFKIKTMRDLSSHEDPYLSETYRITKLGKWLRLSSLDEWPQWWNILKGDMSIIGPRPLPADFLEYIPQVYHARFQVKPGLTGWAQVNGRNELSFQQKLELDCWYVSNRTWQIDFLILLKTPLALFNQNINPDRAPDRWKPNEAI
jgi:sugar transferase EpsL